MSTNDAIAINGLQVGCNPHSLHHFLDVESRKTQRTQVGCSMIFISQPASILKDDFMSHTPPKTNIAPQN